MENRERIDLNNLELDKIKSKIQQIKPVNNQDIEITENGTYTASSGYTGFNEVVVKIPSQEISAFTNSSLGTIKGSTTKGNISANADGTGSVSGFNNLLDKSSTDTHILKGRIQIGDSTSNTANALLHIRKVTSSITGKSVNGACFSVNSDGTASFQHKTYNDDGSGARNAAVLRFSNNGIQFAVNTGSSTTPTEDMYKELATKEYVDSLINDLTTLIDNLKKGDS